MDYRSGVAASWLFPLAFVASLALAKEMIDLLTKESQQPIPMLTCIGITAVVCSNIPLIYFGDNHSFRGAYDPLHLPLLTFLVCMILVLLGEMRR